MSRSPGSSCWSLTHLMKKSMSRLPESSCRSLTHLMKKSMSSSPGSSCWSLTQIMKKSMSSSPGSSCRYLTSCWSLSQLDQVGVHGVASHTHLSLQATDIQILAEEKARSKKNAKITPKGHFFTGSILVTPEKVPWAKDPTRHTEKYIFLNKKSNKWN